MGKRLGYPRGSCRYFFFPHLYYYVQCTFINLNYNYRSLSQLNPFSRERIFCMQIRFLIFDSDSRRSLRGIIIIMASIIDHTVDHRILAFAKIYPIAPKSNSAEPPSQNEISLSEFEGGTPTDKREMAASRTVRISGMPSRRQVR